MADMSQVNDHGDQAEARLPEQFKGKANTVAMVRALAAETQDIEDAAFPMFSLLNIATMIGAQLDGIGDILTERRDGKPDADYRIALFAKGARITASGTPEQVIERFLALTGSTVAVYYGEAFPAGYSIYGDCPACVYPALWTPAEIATALWLDAADASTITEAGGLVSQWDDKSGNNRNATQGTASLQPEIGGSINGVDAISFSNVDNDYLNVSTFGSGTYTWIAVFNNENTVVTTMSLIGSSNKTNAPIGADTSGNTNILRVNDVNDPSGASQLFDGETSQSISDRNDAYDQAAQADGTLYVLRNSPIFDTTIRVGQSASDLYRLDGELGEVICLDGDPDLATRQKVEGYLAWKWGQEGRLPVGHPYKDAAPMVLPAFDLLAAMEDVSPAGVYVGLLDLGAWEDDDLMLWEDDDTVYLTYASSGR